MKIYLVSISWCPLHGAAQDLLDALKALTEFWAYGLSADKEPTADDLKKAEELGAIARAAIQKAGQ